MEVDPPTLAEGVESAPLTVPVPVGDQEVHVPVAGFAESVPMEVDSHPELQENALLAASPSSPTSLKRPTLPPPLLQASSG